MSVDKFGRFSKRLNQTAVAERGPPGYGFHVTLNGDYDIKQKRMTNIREPLDDNDAATKFYVEYEVNKVKEITNSLKTDIESITKAGEFVDAKLDDLKKFFKQVQEECKEKNHD